MSEKIAISNVRMVNKGAFVLQCDVEIKPWHLLLRDIRYFENHNGAWIKMPSVSWVEEEETRYKQLALFTDDDVAIKFKESVCEQIKLNIPEDSGKEFETDEEIPF